MDVHNPAGFWNRFGARLIDGILISLVIGGISTIIFGEFVDETYNSVDLIGLVYGIVLPVVWYGYTIGRKITGNRIVRTDGGKLGIGTMLLRDVVGAIVYAVTLGIGLIVSAFMVSLRDDKRAIHDFIAGTYVTHDPPEKNN
ncbi:RDD family protein [Thalassobacillus pellis]|uniref:RDD family protein n=1 Tax=Thalassobacillus pellis TaxID=748008 RepID=UPI00195FD64A|nr:RDD family protein [Thalassobacillus pellis]MBM7553075.1 putative RDD family membrane protein YckC [Thalassobacillus pellis]